LIRHERAVGLILMNDKIVPTTKTLTHHEKDIHPVARRIPFVGVRAI